MLTWSFSKLKEIKVWYWTPGAQVTEHHKQILSKITLMSVLRLDMLEVLPSTSLLLTETLIPMTFMITRSNLMRLSI